MTAQRTRLATVGILVLILGSGFLMGLAWERGLDAAQPEPEAVAEAEETADEGRRGLIVERVGLTVEQKALVDSIVTHHRDLMREPASRVPHRAPRIDRLHADRAQVCPDHRTSHPVRLPLGRIRSAPSGRAGARVVERRILRQQREEA